MINSQGETHLARIQYVGANDTEIQTLRFSLSDQTTFDSTMKSGFLENRTQCTAFKKINIQTTKQRSTDVLRQKNV